MSPKNTHNRIPRTESDIAALSPVPDVFSLSEPPGIQHKRDPRSGAEFMILDSSVPYPRGLTDEDPLQAAVLPQVGSNPDVFQLPKEYMPVQQVLNEASGAGVGVEGSSALRNAGTSAFQNTFAKIGEVVGTLMSGEKVTPTEVNYRKIILDQNFDGAKAKFLPPVEFAPVQSGPERTAAIEKLRGMLSAGLFENATDSVQRTLTTQGMTAYDEAIEKALKRKR